ncbi:hypothetical protein HPP92_012888 [Vanilla planifolia]|uniref:GOLD domain-containing protein n=1 Tax=Vanilla planifolia TaxID=51239 RepID=A0A835QXP9_VANPL|nr:hypothetical protein HPP92_012888 [Vanilla planifolia]
MEFWPMLMLLVAASIPGGDAVWLNLPPAGPKCVSEEIHTNIVVLGSYAVVYENDKHYSTATISVEVTSPHGNTLHREENVTAGEFGFTSSETGNHMACFWLEGVKKESGASVNLNWRTGIAAKDWHAVAKKEKIEGVELELTKLEGAVEAIHENILYLKDREAEMREVSERTNARVAWLSMLSVGVCIAASALQVLYLKSFFHEKKLL